MELIESVAFVFQIYCSILATAFMFVSFVCMTSIMILMQTSPLYSQGHYHDLSKGWSLHYTAISCLFLTPSPISYLKHGSLDGPMQCLFPGPAFGCCLGALIGTLFSALMFMMKWREALMVRKAFLSQQENLGLVASDADINLRTDSYSPLFGDNIESSPSPSPVGPSPMSALSSFSSLISPGFATPSSFKFERHYSLYGATLRHLNHAKVRLKNLVIFLPPLLNSAHAIILGIWVLEGLAYALNVDIQEVKSHRHRHGDSATFQGDNLSLFEVFPMDHVPILDDPVANLSATYVNEYFADAALARTGDLYLRHNFSMVGQVIEFSPMTTLSAFFNGGAYSMGLLQLVSCFIWPILKVLLWSWFWYTPADEVIRGRIFMWIDALGKVTLANIFVNSILAVINHIDREILIPWYLIPLVVKPFHKLRIHISLSIKPGFGTYGFVVSFVFTMLMGEFNLYIHRLAKRWEEERRALEEKSWRSERGSIRRGGLTSTGGSSTTASSSVSLSPSAAAMTAAMDSDADALAATSSSVGYHHHAAILEDDEERYDIADTPYQMMMTSHDLFDAHSAKKRKRGKQKSRPGNQSQAGGLKAQLQAVTGGGTASSEEERALASFRLDGDAMDELEDRTPPPPPLAEKPRRSRGSRRGKWHPGDHISFADQAMDGQVAFYDQHSAEAPCNHIYSPIPGRFHRCTILGKAVMALLMLTTIIFLVFGITLDTFVLHRSGVVGNYIIAKDVKDLSLSVVEFPDAISQTGYRGEVPYTLTATMWIFVIGMPVLHVLCLSLLWWVPLRPPVQMRLQVFMENLSAWSALDVFTVTIFFTSLDIGGFASQLIDGAGMKPLDDFLKKIGLGAFIEEDQSLTSNYAVLVFAMLFEKLLEMNVQLQLATMLSERKGVFEIARKAAEIGSRRRSSASATQPPNATNANLDSIEEEGAPSASTGLASSGATVPLLTPVSTSSQEYGQQNAPLLTTELIREHLDVLSPTQNYFSAGGLHGYFYAGLPRFMWKFFIRVGLMSEDHTFTLAAEMAAAESSHSMSASPLQTSSANAQF